MGACVKKLGGQGQMASWLDGLMAWWLDREIDDSMTVEIDVLTSPFSVSSSLVIEVAVRCVHQLLGKGKKQESPSRREHQHLPVLSEFE